MLLRQACPERLVEDCRPGICGATNLQIEEDPFLASLKSLPVFAVERSVLVSVFGRTRFLAWQRQVWRQASSDEDNREPGRNR